MNLHKVQVSPQPALNNICLEDHNEHMDYFILEKTWYAINSYIKWFGVNPWKRQVDENDAYDQTNTILVTIGDSSSNHQSFVYLSDCLCLHFL